MSKYRMSTYSPQFERARQAVTTITTVRPYRSSSELESLTLMFNKSAMDTIERSLADAQRGDFESLEEAIKKN